MLIDNKIILHLTNQAIKQSQLKNEVKAFYSQKVNGAFDFWNNNDNQKAIEEISLVLNILPDLNILLIAKALFYSSSKNPQQSNQIIGKISSNEATDLELNMIDFIQSCNFLHVKDYEGAIKTSTNIISRDHKAYYAYLPRAVAYQEINDQKSAIKDFKMALKEKLQTKGIKAGLAFSYMKNKNYFRGLYLHLKVIKHFNDNFRVNHNIGINYFMLNLSRKALFHINRSIELKKDFADAYRTRGLIYMNQGKNKLAYEELLKAKKYGARDIDNTMLRFQNKLKKYET